MNAIICPACGKTNYSAADPEHLKEPCCLYCHADLRRKTLTDARKIELIDEYLEEPNNLSREWVEMLIELREEILSRPKGLSISTR